MDTAEQIRAERREEYNERQRILLAKLMSERVVYNGCLLARDFHSFGQKAPIWEKLDTSLLRHKSKNKRKLDPEHAEVFFPT